MTDAINSEPYFGHSGDFDYDLNGPAKLKEIETKLGIRGILEHLKSAGWESYQWRNSPDGKKSFLEMSGMAYSDFRRTNSTAGIKHAAEDMLNRVQAIVRCEQTTGHDFTERAGFVNGVLACRHCGFGGYGSNYLQQTRDINNWKDRAESANEQLALVALRVGVRFNAVGQVMLPNASIVGSDKGEGYIALSDTDQVSFVLKHETEEGSQ